MPVGVVVRTAAAGDFVVSGEIVTVEILLARFPRAEIIKKASLASFEVFRT